MGQITVICRLALRDLRRRPAQAVLLLVALTAALATATRALVLHGVTSQPYAQTRAATAGPDVTASSAGLSPNQLQSFKGLAHAQGVAAASGPFPVAWPVLRARGLTAYAMAEGRDEAAATVDQPDVLQGSWVRPGGVVVERAFADALGVRVGDVLTLDGRPFRVTGIAVTAAVPVFSQVCFYAQCSGPGGKPRSPDTGLIWLTRTAAQSLTQPGNPVTSYLNLRLTDPAQAPAFVSAHQMTSRTGSSALTAWPSLSDAAATLVAQEQNVLLPASWLLGLLAVASVAVVAGSRMAEQNRRVGLLKAAGGTPPLAAAVLLAEHLAVALAAAATLVPAVRAARISTVVALAEAVRPPRRAGPLIALSAWLPVPLLLGLRLVARRPRRALLSAASLTVTATAIMAVLIFHATVRPHAGPAGPADPGDTRVSEVLLVITVVMIILAAANAMFTTWANVLDARRLSAIVRSLGATPQQTVAGLSAAQILPAVVGALLGIPAGTALYGAVQNGGPQGSPSSWWLLAMVAGLLLGVAALTAIPARIGARRSAAAILQAETP